MTTNGSLRYIAKYWAGTGPLSPPVPMPMLTAPCSTIIATSPSRSCNFHGFVLHYQHDSFPDSSCNFCGFIHNFSPGLSCSCHSFMLHCQHISSLDLLDNPPCFCQLSSDCLLCSTTPRILHTFTLILSSRVHTC